jgi:L-fucose mutarotase/ribose pyranase (RbsD/FucU family)
LDDFAFHYNAFGRKIYVPENSVNTYKTANGWKAYADDIMSDKKYPVNSISLDKTSVEMAKGDEITLTATINPDNASNKSVIWSSSNTSVAIVDNGKVTALTTGQTTITVKTVDGEKTATCVITVIAKVYNVESISLNKSKLSMMTGDEEILEATITPENAADKTITWSSDNPMIASVDNGKVKAHQLGTATITATTQDGCKTASCIISVVDIDSMIDVSFSGMDVLSGSLSFEGSFIKLTPGVNLKVSITNYSNHSITLTGFKLICGKLHIPRNYTLEEMEIPGKKVLGLTVPISIMAIYSPIAEITYRYDSKTYTASVQFDGTFKSKQSYFKGDLISLTPYPLL